MSESATPLESVVSPIEMQSAEELPAVGLLGESNVTSDSELLVNDVAEPAPAVENEAFNEAQQKAAREAYLSNPEIQAEIIFQNYVNSSDRILSGQQKRTLKREILRNAKKGKYKHLFSEEAQQREAERNDKKFGKLNSPE